VFKTDYIPLIRFLRLIRLRILQIILRKILEQHALLSIDAEEVLLGYPDLDVLQCKLGGLLVPSDRFPNPLTFIGEVHVIRLSALI